MTKELALATIEAELEVINENKYSTIIHYDRGCQFNSKDYKDLLLKWFNTINISTCKS